MGASVVPLRQKPNDNKLESAVSFEILGNGD